MKKIFLLVLFLICVSPTVSSAADFSVQADKKTFSMDEDFLVQVFLDTKKEAVNAIEGMVTFPPDLVEVKEIRDGNSIVNFWIDKPHRLKDGVVSFSGITPGGFSGSSGFLFSLVLHPVKSGSGRVSLNQTQVLKNDGLGTKVSAINHSFNFSISKTLNGEKPNDLSVVDTNPPEDFAPFIGNDSAIFEDQYFVVFSTTDKGVGVGHYEVRESLLFGLDGDYAIAESPYLLKDQNLLKNVYIKAVDKNGNERVVKINGQNRSARLLQFAIFAIIVLVCIFMGKKVWPKFLRR